MVDRYFRLIAPIARSQYGNTASLASRHAEAENLGQGNFALRYFRLIAASIITKGTYGNNHKRLFLSAKQPQFVFCACGISISPSVFSKAFISCLIK